MFRHIYLYILRKLVVIFIYVLLFIIYIVQLIIIIKNHYFNILLKQKHVFIGIFIQITCNILTLLILIIFISVTFIFLIPLTSISIKEFLSKLMKILFMVTCCYLICHFNILRYIIILMIFI